MDRSDIFVRMAFWRDGDTIPSKSAGYMGGLEEMKLRYKLQRNPAIAHFKGPVDFMPYCERCLIANE